MSYYGEAFGAMQRLKPGKSRIHTLDDLYGVLRCCWSKASAFPRCQADWSPEDPSYGQCAITAMLVHDMFGGSIHKICYEGGGTHYFNKIDGHYIDLTHEQFSLYHIPVEYEPNQTVDRHYCGQNPDTKKRFELLIHDIAAFLASESANQ